VAGIAPAIGLPGVAQSPSEGQHGGRTTNDAVAMILLVEDDAPDLRRLRRCCHLWTHCWTHWCRHRP
jgi:hypothetical protein